MLKHISVEPTGDAFAFNSIEGKAGMAWTEPFFTADAAKCIKDTGMRRPRFWAYLGLWRMWLSCGTQSTWTRPWRTWPKQAHPVSEADQERLSPLGFAHINFHGRISFDLPEAVQQGQLRPLRTPRPTDPIHFAFT